MFQNTVRLLNCFCQSLRFIDLDYDWIISPYSISIVYLIIENTNFHCISDHRKYWLCILFPYYEYLEQHAIIESMPVSGTSLT